MTSPASKQGTQFASLSEATDAWFQAQQQALHDSEARLSAVLRTLPDL